MGERFFTVFCDLLIKCNVITHPLPTGSLLVKSGQEWAIGQKLDLKEICYDLQTCAKVGTLLTRHEFYEVLATYSWGDEYMVSHKDFKGVWYDIELWPRKMVQDHCSTFTQMHSLDGALNRIDLRERVYGSDKELHTSWYDPLT